MLEFLRLAAFLTLCSVGGYAFAWWLDQRRRKRRALQRIEPVD